MTLAEEMYGPEPVPKKKRSLAEEMYGPEEPTDPTEQMVESLPEFVRPGAEKALEHVKKVQQKEKIYGAEGRARAVTGPIDIIGKATELKAQARGPLKEEFTRRIEKVEEPARRYLQKRKAAAPPAPPKKPSLAEEMYGGEEPKPRRSLAEEMYPAVAPELAGKVAEFARAVLPFGEKKEKPYTVKTWPASRTPTPAEIEKQGKLMGLTQREVEEHKGRSQMPLQAGEPGSKQLGQTMEWMENIFGAPFRALGGAQKDITEWAKWGAGYLADPENPGPMPDMPGLSVLPSVLKEKGKTVYPMDLGVEAMADLKLHLIPEVVKFERALGEVGPDEILTENEKMASGGIFLLSEIFGYGPILKLMRLGRGGPGAEAVAKHARKAVKMTKEEAGKIGRLVMDMPTHPESVAKFHSEIFRVAKKMGMSEAEAAAAARKGLQIIGHEGRYLAKQGARLKVPMTKRAALETQVGEAKRLGRRVAGVPEEVSKGIPARDIPMGAGRPPLSVSRVPGVGKMWYGAESARGTAEAIRPGLGYAQRGAVGEAGGKQLSKMMGKPAKEVEFARITDLRDNLAVKDRLVRNVTDLEESLKVAKTTEGAKLLEDEIKVALQNVDRAERQLQTAYKRAGMTEAEVRAGFKAETPQQKQAAQLFDEGMVELNRIEQRVGLRHGERESYMPRIETREGKALRKKMGAPAKPTGAEAGFMKKRQEHLGTTVAGTRDRTFVEEVGTIHAMRHQSHHVVVGAKLNEDALIRGYASGLTDDMARARGLKDVDELLKNETWLRELKAKGLKPYRGTLGNNRGMNYIMDRGSAEMLEKALNPIRYQGFVKHWSRLHNWWKGWATVLRPNFVERNVFFGNVWNAWLADVDLVNAPYLAMKVQMKMAAQSPLGKNAVVNTLTGQMAKRANKVFPAKLAGRRVSEKQLDDWMKWGLEDGVPSGGMFGAELGSQRYKFFLMRLNKKLNILGEDNFRWAVYIDSLQKGYGRREAMSRVAKVCFNYNEQAAFGQAARQIFSFSTWNLKNWGLQLTSLLNKPDKFSKFVRGWTGTQALDPLDPLEEEAMGLDYLQDWVPFFLPAARGEKGGRQKIAGKGLFPMLNILDIAEPERAMQTAAEMINPLLRYVAEKVSSLVQKGRPERFSTHPRDPTVRYALVPNWVHGLLDFSGNIGPHLRSMMMWALGVYPVGDRYKWSKDTEEYFGLHPGIGTLNRATRPRAEQFYSAIWNLATPFRLSELTPEKINRHLQEKWGIGLKDLEEIELHMKQLDVMVDPYNPLRHSY